MESNESRPLPETEEDGAAAAPANPDGGETLAAPRPRPWLPYLVVAIGAGLLGVFGPPALQWIGQRLHEVAAPAPLPPFEAGDAANGDRPSATASLSPAPAPTVPTQPEAVTDDRLPKPDSPLPTTQDQLIKEVDGITDCLLERFPNDPDAIEIKARYQDWRGNSAEAMRGWERCLALNPSYGYALYGMGTVAAKQGDFAKAVEWFRKALALKPDWPKAELELSRALINLGQTEEAAATLEKHVQRRPFLTEAHFLLGQAYEQRKNYAKAKESYTAAIRLGVRTSESHNGLVNVCARLGEKDLAQQHLEKFRELRSKEADLRKRQRVEYDDLKAMKEDSAGILVSAGQLFFAREKRAEAEVLCRRAAAYDPLQVESRQALAFICRQSGRLPEAIGFLQEIAKLDAKNPSYFLEIGRLQAELKQFDAAEASFRTVCQLAPKDAAGPSALAQLYLASNRDLGEVRKLVEKAAELEPTPVNYAVLAAICEKAKDLPAASAAMKRAMEMDPNNPGYRKAYEWLQAQQSGK